jgi:hypothetical protein
LASIALWLATAACAASRQSSAVTATPMEPGSPHAQIAQLSQQLDDRRQQLGLPVPSVNGCQPSCAVSAMSVEPRGDAQCHPGQSDACSQTCTLADSICDNAQKICELASQLPGDAWAAQKCSDGKSTCEAAHAKCCACTA